MTLFRQIVTVFSLFFLLMLAAVLAISFDDARGYIEDELYTRAQNTASTLGVTMSQTEGDVTKMSVMADAVFDTGYYKKIELKTMRGKTIFKKEREVQPVVPHWFARMSGLHNQSAYAQVSNGWQPLGMLEVTSDASSSMQYLYTLFKKIVSLFLLSALLAILIIVLALRRILRPIHTMEEQAEGVLQNRFILNRDIPRTKELRRVTLAINGLVERMEQMHRKLIELTSRNRELEYVDPLTGVGNRRFFTVRYEEFVRSHDGTAEGCAVAIRLCGTEEANRRIGYDAVNVLIRKIAEEVRQMADEVSEESVVCRLSGMEIIVLLPGMGEEKTLQWGEKLLVQLRCILDNQKEVAALVYLAAAIAPYRSHRAQSELLASLDLGLNDAAGGKSDGIRAISYDTPLPTRKTQWRELILEAIGQKRLLPKLRDIFSEDGREVSAVLQFDLETEEGETIPYRIYAPMMQPLGLYPEYLRYLFDYLLTEKELRCSRVFVEFPVAYLDTTHHFETMLSYAKRLKKKRRELVVELGQNDLMRRDPSVLSAIAEELSKQQIPLAIVRFNADAKILERLHLLRPAFVRIDVTQYLDMGETLRDSLALLLRSIGTRLLIGGVQSPEELARLEETGGDYFIV